MEDMNYLDWTTIVLVLVGALNWGLVGLGTLAGQNYNLVNILLGTVMNGQLEALVYLLVGLSGLYQVFFVYSKTQVGETETV